MSLVTYRAQYAWTCPDCKTVNYLTRRPRRRKAVACGAHDFQHITTGGCGVVHQIDGQETNP